MPFPVTSFFRYLRWRSFGGSLQFPSDLKDIILPIDLTPPIICYLHHSHLLGTYPLHAKNDNLLLSNYINISLRGTTNREVEYGRLGFIDFDPFLTFDGLERRGLLRVDQWDLKSFRDVPRDEIARKAIGSLERGSYIELNVNEYFMLGSAAERNLDLRHHTLIYGFDAQHQRFLCAAYLRDGSYGAATIPAGLLADAVFSRARPTLNCGHSYNTALIRDVSFNGHLSHQLSVPQARKQLIDFLSSRTSSVSPLDTMNFGDAQFGRQIYATLQPYFRNVTDLDIPINLNVSRLLWERQKLMRMRISVFAELGHISRRSTLFYKSDLLEKAFHNIHLECVALNLRLARNSNTWSLDRRFTDACQQDLYLTEGMIAALPASL